MADGPPRFGGRAEALLYRMYCKTLGIAIDARATRRYTSGTTDRWVRLH